MSWLGQSMRHWERRSTVFWLLLSAPLVCLGLVVLATPAYGFSPGYDGAPSTYDAIVDVALNHDTEPAILLVPAVSSQGSASRASGTAEYTYDATARFVAPGSAADDLLVACLRSFSADTEVLMADGTTKPISEIVSGDEVWALDPATGEAGTRAVMATWPHEDTLLEFTVEGGSVTTTEDHHFWNVTDSAWQETQHIDPGDHLLTADGHTVRAGNLDWSTAHDADAYDLTIVGVHTYFVSTGDEHVLVHNCNEMLGARGTQVTSQTLTNRPGYRIDVENPAPGVRPGQLHLQTDSSKFLYDFETEQFVGIPRSLQRTIDRDPAVQRAIATGRRYLGLDQ